MKIKDIFSRIVTFFHRVPWCVVWNFFMLYVFYMICRVAFVIENYDMLGAGLTPGLIVKMARGGLLFDTSAIFYTNLLYLLLVLFPFHKKEIPVVHIITKWIFVVINAIFLFVNLADSVYYAFSEKRATLLMYNEFSGNTNGGTVVGIELINHWGLVLLWMAMVIVLYVCYSDARCDLSKGKLKRYYLRHSISLVVFTVLAIAGIRGSFFSTSSRPIAMSNAHEYVDKPSQAAIVVNTPFSIIRTALKRQAHVPPFYDDDTQMLQYYTAVHVPSDSVVPDKKNVVILIVESFAEEFIGARNRDLDNGTYKGYTEFVDSLIEHTLTFEHTYANGWLSIDAMPSVLASIPKMYTSFVLTPYALDDITSVANLLGDWGYESAFFHGAENSSMGFQAFARSAGFQNYYGRSEYYDDPRTAGKADFDGTWAIWDEEFLQYMCMKLDEMQQPFVASVFTASSHHPFAIPERYKSKYPEEGVYPIHKCVRYTDNALRRFFDTAKTQPWYKNTIFVLTADHASSRVTHEVYRTAEGDYRVPILFYDPSGALPAGVRPGIAQQIDIMPTLLGILGYDKPYVAFGKDMLATDAADTWAFNWHNVPQYMKGDYLLQYNDFAVSGIYNLRTDRMMKHNLVGTDRYDKAYVEQMVKELQSILQTVDSRMKSDDMNYGNDKK